MAKAHRIDTDGIRMTVGSTEKETSETTEPIIRLEADHGPTPVKLAGPGICGRTPEIQNELIKKLNIPS